MKIYRTLLFYKYVHIENAEQYAAQHLKLCIKIGLKGRVLVADEGINGTVSGTIEQTKQYINHLHADPLFSDMIFKIDEEEKNSFAKMHVRYKKEIVRFGIEQVNVWEHAGKYLEPEEWMKVKDNPNVVVIDFRNEVEWEVGKFKNAVTLPITHFREVPHHLHELEKYKDKKVLAYCTGGIRCEKATAFLIEKGFKEVYHLHGGIIEYGKKVGGKDFDGKCYVFDNRITVDVNSVNPQTISHCYVCGKPSSRFINCANDECNRHFILCEDCGWKMEGSCSDECKHQPDNRKYDGTGFYQKRIKVEHG
ncbi:MAG: rhodanese-related sulfurtransferase [Chitinophagales bacterium]|nr:rhodanese-related sulfurtransferase [Chitinophagales bacterium]